MRLTYAEVGATRHEKMPAGYEHVVRNERIGQGRAAFDRAADGLFAWQMHLIAGLRPAGPLRRPAEGVEVRLRFVVMTIPCRVVYVIDEPDQRGFAYGTLPGHPESGEEAFLVHRDADDTVRFEIRAFSRPATLLTRLGGPASKLVQRYATGRYVKAMRQVAR